MRRALIVSLLLLAAIFVAFAPAFQNGFVHYDDPTYVTENPQVLAGLTGSGVTWAFQTGLAGNWNPLTWISHMLDVTLFGVNPFGHHLTSLLLHAITALLLFGWLNAVTRNFWRAAIVAALFGLHPTRVESVAWVAERKDVLSGFFFMLTLLAYSGYVARCPNAPRPPAPNSPRSDSSRWVFYSGSLFCFALGLMSKPMLVTVPLVLLLIDYWPHRRFNQASWLRLLLEKIPFFGLAVASGVVTIVTQNRVGALNSIEQLSLPFRIGNALISYCRYVGEAISPANLAVFYPAPTEWPLAAVAAAGVGLAVVTVAAVVVARRLPYVAIGWLWFLVMLTPVIGIIQVGNQALADRYSYLPFIGLFIAPVWWLGGLAETNRRMQPWLAAGAAVVLGVCVWLTNMQTRYWHDEATLFAHALEVTTDNYVAHNNLGVTLFDAGNLAAAEPHFAEAVRLRPRYAVALANLALCRQQAAPAEAAELFQRALDIEPLPNAHYNLANLLSNQRRFEDAEKHYRAAIDLKPAFAEAWYNLGLLKTKTGKPDEAADAFEQALKIRPDYTEVRLARGAMFGQLKKFDAAAADFNAILKTNPGDSSAHFNLAAILSAQGDFEQSATHYAEAARLQPSDPDAQEGLALALLSQHKMAEASAAYERALQLRPSVQNQYRLAYTFDARGLAADAATHYREALKLAPNTPAILNDLAWLLATTDNDLVRNASEAVRLARQATQMNPGEPRFWGTLDTALAEAGEFDEAIATAAKTRELALAAGQTEIAKAADERLALYREHKSYRRTTPSKSQ